MKEYPTAKIRNIALVGHSGSGKTALAEAALFVSGALTRMGKTEEGNTVSDFDAEEIRRTIPQMNVYESRTDRNIGVFRLIRVGASNI